MRYSVDYVLQKLSHTRTLSTLYTEKWIVWQAWSYVPLNVAHQHSCYFCGKRIYVLYWSTLRLNDSYNAQHLEHFQRILKKIGGLREVSFENRLSRLELPTLSMRRLYLDTKFTHKLLKNKLNVPPHDLGVNYLVSCTRDNGISLIVNRSKTANMPRTLFLEFLSNGTGYLAPLEYVIIIML